MEKKLGKKLINKLSMTEEQKKKALDAFTKEVEEYQKRIDAGRQLAQKKL